MLSWNPQWEFRFDISWIYRDLGISRPGVIPRDPNPKLLEPRAPNGCMIHLGMPHVGCSSPIPSGEPWFAFGMPKASLDKDWSCLGLWNAWNGTGLKVWDSLQRHFQWEILFYSPGSAGMGEKDPSNSMKTGISKGKSTLPAQFSCQEDPVGFWWVNSVWSIQKNQLHPVFFFLIP